MEVYVMFILIRSLTTIKSFCITNSHEFEYIEDEIKNKEFIELNFLGVESDYDVILLFIFNEFNVDIYSLKDYLFLIEELDPDDLLKLLIIKKENRKLEIREIKNKEELYNDYFDEIYIDSTKKDIAYELAHKNKIPLSVLLEFIDYKELGDIYIGQEYKHQIINKTNVFYKTKR